MSVNRRLMTTTYKFTKELEFQMSLGAHLFPEYPQRSFCESIYGLRKTMGDYHSNMDAMDISPSEYRKNKFVIRIDTEKNARRSFHRRQQQSWGFVNITNAKTRFGSSTNWNL